MATNQKKENENTTAKTEVKSVDTEVKATIPNIDIPVDGPECTEEHSNNDYKDINAVCDMVNSAKKTRDEEDKKRREEEEKDRQRQENDALAAQKAESAKAEQAETARKITEGRYIRKKMKRKATAMLFALCLMSAIFGYVVAGVLIYILFNPKVWIFVGVMGIFGMVNTLIHTYLYRFIREEIYRK